MGFSRLAFALPVAVAIVITHGTAAEAVMLSFSGRVHLHEPAASSANRLVRPIPVAAAQVTVTFHGHEAGITEYTTERIGRVRTDETGLFAVDIKISEYRYRWTHATVAVSATDISKEMTILATLHNDGQGGHWGAKDVVVMPQ